MNTFPILTTGVTFFSEEKKAEMAKKDEAYRAYRRAWSAPFLAAAAEAKTKAEEEAANQIVAPPPPPVAERKQPEAPPTNQYE